ncbi:hypothetical protein [Nonomuraea phyllanthi]|uniref:hypothetical protein n=1 Tax=Nonomuraea phyllanthi TaxID=2219224 RepID=UPI001294017C|nr:hypothetical protein [Nonomuraea phyllanthi]
MHSGARRAEREALEVVRGSFGWDAHGGDVQVPADGLGHLADRDALDALTATFTPDRREFSARLRAVIAGNGELRERAADPAGRQALAGLARQSLDDLRAATAALT